MREKATRCEDDEASPRLCEERSDEAIQPAPSRVTREAYNSILEYGLDCHLVKYHLIVTLLSSYEVNYSPAKFNLKTWK